MPKLKTNRGAKKRFRVTGTGKIKRNRSGHRHILTSKDQKRKRRLRQATLVHEADTPRALRMLGLR
jgi:large subunit ribosomal protein L35